MLKISHNGKHFYTVHDAAILNFVRTNRHFELFSQSLHVTQLVECWYGLDIKSARYMMKKRLLYPFFRVTSFSTCNTRAHLCYVQMSQTLIALFYHLKK